MSVAFCINQKPRDMPHYTYLIVNPFGSAENGVTAYTASLKAHLKEMSIDTITVEELAVNQAFSLEKIRHCVHQHITHKYGYDEVIIEAPETRAATLYLPKEYRVHIRLHCPLKVAETADLKIPNQARYSDELRVIHKATVVSSPSQGLVREMCDEVDPKRLLVYKNPIDSTITQFRQTDRPYDVVFMGRFTTLKGADFLLPLLKRLPKHYRVLMFGPLGESWLKNCYDSKPGCEVTVYDNISGDIRFEYLASAKVCIVPSRFENCSMAVLESLSVGTPVVAWDVGGNREIAGNDVLRLAPLGDLNAMVRHIMDLVNAPTLSYSSFDRALEAVNQDFKVGWKEALQRLIDCPRPASDEPYPSFTDQASPQVVTQPLKSINSHLTRAREKSIVDLFYRLKIFGFSISNEHLEEMWMPVIQYLGAKYQLVCPRKMGHVSRFDKKYPIDHRNLFIYNWEQDPNRLIAQINAFEPDLIFFHNGIHPRYQGVLQYIRERVGVPFVYTELGWLPQHNHIYFDRYGVNARSWLATLTAESIIEQTDIDDNLQIETQGNYTLIIGQLENDTNLIVSSPRFHSMENFIDYVLSELPETEQVLIKPHPLDKKLERYERFISDRVTIVTDQALDTLLPKAKAVVGINSTAFFEALKYPVNIYALGHSILDNKGVLIDCTQCDLSTVWTNTLYGTIKRRQKLLNAFARRQINVNQLLKEGLDWALNSRTLDPLVDALDIGHSRNRLWPTERAERYLPLKHLLYLAEHKKPPFHEIPNKQIPDFLNEAYAGAQTGRG